MTPENEELMAKTKAELGDRYVKNFEYHTAHAYFTMGRVLREELGEDTRRQDPPKDARRL